MDFIIVMISPSLFHNRLLLMSSGTNKALLVCAVCRMCFRAISSLARDYIYF